MNIKKGDKVIMLSGKDRHKSGRVLTVWPIESKVLVEGLALIKRHLRPRRQGQKGQIVNKESAVPIARVQLLCPKCGKATRVGHRIEGSVKFRICKKCLADI